MSRAFARRGEFPKDLDRRVPYTMSFRRVSAASGRLRLPHPFALFWRRVGNPPSKNAAFPLSF